ncbi:MAG: tRNA dihydrouridine synthase DusB [Calditrichia bacterium]
MLEINGYHFSPAFVLAPMEDVSDTAFRRLCKELGADVVYTEFISSEALIRDAAKAHRKMFFYPEEHPVGIQLYGSRLDSILEAGKIAEQVRPDFIDLNVGCPVTKVADQGMGAGLLKNCDLMASIVREMINNLSLPVTVKMRIGWDENSINVLENVQVLNRIGVHWIAIHARTRSQAYKGKADWSWIKKAKEISQVPIIGNGDITSVEDAEKALEFSGADGIMIGRGAIKAPWIFKQLKAYFMEGKVIPEPEFEEKITLARTHFRYLAEHKGDYAVAAFKRFNNTYFKGVKHVANIRQAVSKAKTIAEMVEILDNPFKLL